ncbi:MAG: glycosyl hydrolase family 28 protein [Verrucomicrobia bacterium]|nr:glycosyl hydrolase family 28 protein [Verrucomicrobiota bacterium]
MSMLGPSTLNYRFMITALFAVAAVWAVSSVLAGVVTHPAPAGETLSVDYKIVAGGQPVAVYTARTLDTPFAGKEWDFGGPYSFANFVTDGTVEVRVTSPRSLRATVIRPAWPDVKMRLESDGTLVVSLPGPRKLSIEPDGKKGPLLLFANPPEAHPPKPDAPGVIYFGPGIHRPGRIDVTNNQTLYLAGGAVVKGGVFAQGENIRIMGQGILDSSDYEWRKGPTPHVISICGTNVAVSGITIRGASHWTIVLRDSRRVTVRGVKLCGSRVQNDDGINPCNSQDVLITDCFIRTDDDCVALKGLEFTAPNNNVERITVEDCVLWSDRARIFLLGHESRAPFMRGITLRNLDIIHFSMTPFLLEPGEEMRLEDVLVEDVRLHGEGQPELARLKPVVNQYMRKQVPGYVQNIRFRNVALAGQTGAYFIQLSGADAAHAVRGVTFDNVEILGKRLALGSERLQVGEHVEGVCFPGVSTHSATPLSPDQRGRVSD